MRLVQAQRNKLGHDGLLKEAAQLALVIPLEKALLLRNGTDRNKYFFMMLKTKYSFIFAIHKLRKI
jgi:hypothetical protein